MWEADSHLSGAVLPPPGRLRLTLGGVILFKQQRRAAPFVANLNWRWQIYVRESRKKRKCFIFTAEEVRNFWGNIDHSPRVSRLFPSRAGNGCCSWRLFLFCLLQILLLIRFIACLYIFSWSHITCAAQSVMQRFYNPATLQLLLQLIIGHISHVKKWFNKKGWRLWKNWTI